MRLRPASAAIALAATAFLALAAPRLAMAGNLLDDAAACAGSLIGNATADLSQGREDRFDEGVDLAYAGYLTHVFAAKGAYKQADLELADKILAINTDRVIEAANSNAFDAEVYEQIVACSQFLALQVMRNAAVYADNAKRIAALSADNKNRIRRLVKAGRR
ncbi:MAG: hypothetical protein FJX69_06635 [Alphaproteobacteria bacterium]|nr:hypothetical protein [Alphaproteobacteria bacterium]